MVLAQAAQISARPVRKRRQTVVEAASVDESAPVVSNHTQAAQISARPVRMRRQTVVFGTALYYETTPTPTTNNETSKRRRRTLFPNDASSTDGSLVNSAIRQQTENHGDTSADSDGNLNCFCSSQIDCRQKRE